MAELLGGADAVLEGEAEWLSESGLPLAGNGRVDVDGRPIMRSENRAQLELIYHPQKLARRRRLRTRLRS